LVVALAGPAVNVVLAILLYFGVQALAGTANVGATIESGMNQLDSIGDKGSSLSSLSELSLLGAQFLAKLLVVNVALAVFNLLPAFPMDGGRVLRALLAMRMDYVRATQVAAAIGQGMALLFGFVGLFSNPFLVFIALFVWMGAAAESSMVQMRSALGGIPIIRAMITDFRTISPQDRLEDVAAHVIAGFQQDFPVTDHGKLVGMLTRTDLLKSLAEQGRDERVESVMRRDFQQVDPSEMLEGMIERLHTCDCPALPVVHGGELVGVINMENIGEFMAVQSALKNPNVRGLSS
jgi:CBS domain-containing protein